MNAKEASALIKNHLNKEEELYVKQLPKMIENQLEHIFSKIRDYPSRYYDNQGIFSLNDDRSFCVYTRHKLFYLFKDKIIEELQNRGFTVETEHPHHFIPDDQIIIKWPKSSTQLNPSKKSFWRKLLFWKKRE